MAKSSGARREKPKPEPQDPTSALAAKVDGTGPLVVTITTPQEYSAAAETLKGMLALRKEIAAFFTPLKQEALKGHRALCAKENELLAKVEERERAVNQAIAAFKAERDRIAKEVAEAEAAKAREEEEARRAAEAAAAKAAGNKGLAKEILATPVSTPFVPVKSDVPAVDGLHFRDELNITITDSMELLRGIARPSIFREIARAFRAKAAEPGNLKDKPSIERCAAYLEVGADRIFQGATIELVEFKAGKLKDLVKRCGGEHAKIPGVKVEKTEKPVTRT